MADSPHASREVEVVREALEWFSRPLANKHDSAKARPALAAFARLEEQLQTAHDALVKIAEGPSDTSPPEIARCALRWPAHGWEQGVYEQVEVLDKQRLKWERLAMDRGFALESTQEQYADLQRVAGKAVGDAVAWEAENRGLKEQMETYERALREIADRRYERSGAKKWWASAEVREVALNALLSNPASEPFGIDSSGNLVQDAD